MHRIAMSQQRLQNYCNAGCPADGEMWSPVFVVPGVTMPLRKKAKAGNTCETVLDFLRSNAYVYARKIPGVDTDIFDDWSRRFIEDTAALRRRVGTIVLTLDGYAAHLSLPALTQFRDNGIVVVALPSHTSHKTQVLDASCFYPFKIAVKDVFHDRALQTSRQQVSRNDVFTLVEIVSNAYYKTMTNENMRSVFSASAVWSDEKGGVDVSVVSNEDFVMSSRYNNDSPVTTSRNLLRDYVRTVPKLLSDGFVFEHGRLPVSHAGGATLTGNDVMKRLERREQQRREEN